MAAHCRISSAAPSPHFVHHHKIQKSKCRALLRLVELEAVDNDLDPLLSIVDALLPLVLEASIRIFNNLKDLKAEVNLDCATSVRGMFQYIQSAKWEAAANISIHTK